jgi:4-hydroxysphinganine ceramide fatty acyl 2-hydroxylase
MERISPNVSEADQLLSRSTLDFITCTNVRVYYVTYSLLILYFSLSGFRHVTAIQAMTSMAVGVMIWSLLEYVIHRFVFHWKAKSAMGKMIVFIFHDVHHAYPQDVRRSITPLIFSLPLVAILYVVFKAMTGIQADSMLSGSLIGYVLYSAIHDSTHHFPMRFLLAKQLKRNHLRHHYFDGEKNFGVTSPLWDWVFSTFARKQ